VAAGDADAPLRGLALVRAAVLLGLANFMVILDISIANVSVPHIAGSLAVSPSQGVWAITSYSVADAITVPLSGWLAERFGPVRVFRFGVVGFGLASLCCGIAPSFGLLIGFRIVQGLCGGPIMPMSQTLLVQIFPKDQSARALGIWTATTILAPMMGPLIGGYISDNAHWSWIFLINVPVAAAVAVISGPLLAGQDAPGRRAPVDYLGLALLVAWVAPFQLMLDRGRELDWLQSPLIAGLAVTAAIGFIAFVVWELRCPKPIVGLRIFGRRAVAAGMAAIGLAFGAMFAGVVVGPLWAQTTLGYTATQAGATGIGFGFMAVAASPIVARLIGGGVTRVLISFGLGCMAAGMSARTGFDLDVTFLGIAMPQLLVGFGTSFFYIPATNLILGDAPPAEAAGAAGLASFIRTLSSAFGGAIGTTIWENQTARDHSLLVGALAHTGEAADRAAAQGLAPDQGAALLERLVEQQAAMLAANHVFAVAAAVFAAAAAAIWFVPRAAARAVAAAAPTH